MTLLPKKLICISLLSKKVKGNLLLYLYWGSASKFYLKKTIFTLVALDAVVMVMVMVIFNSLIKAHIKCYKIIGKKKKPKVI